MFYHSFCYSQSILFLFFCSAQINKLALMSRSSKLFFFVKYTKKLNRAHQYIWLGPVFFLFFVYHPTNYTRGRRPRCRLYMCIYTCGYIDHGAKSLLLFSINFLWCVCMAEYRIYIYSCVPFSRTFFGKIGKMQKFWLKMNTLSMFLKLLLQ